MVNFSKAIQTVKSSIKPDGTTIYKGSLDSDWSVIASPHGGATLALICQAIKQFQKSANTHPDPISIQATFLGPSTAGLVEVHVGLAKSRSKRYSYLNAELFQKGKSIVTLSAIYGQLPPLPTTHLPFSHSNQYLLPLTPSPYAPISPMLTHPSVSDPAPQDHEFGRRWSSNSILNFMKWMNFSEDIAIKERREANGASVGSGKSLEWGAWCELKEGERITSESLPLFADLFSSIPDNFPEQSKVEPTWYPTMTFSMQFFASLPVLEPYLFAPHTVGLYSFGKLIREGMHQQNVEVWTAPSAIGSGESQVDWRKRSMLLCTSTQLALSVPIPQDTLAGLKRGGSKL